jgi:PAS domain S-box
MKARGRTLGALMLVSSNPRRLYDDDALTFAEHLGRRSAAAVDNALLYRRSEQRAQAARALAFVADGVLLVDEDGIVRIWNAAAEAITGLREQDVFGRPGDRGRVRLGVGRGARPGRSRPCHSARRDRARGARDR